MGRSKEVMEDKDICPEGPTEKDVTEVWEKYRPQLDNEGNVVASVPRRPLTVSVKAKVASIAAGITSLLAAACGANTSNTEQQSPLPKIETAVPATSTVPATSIEIPPTLVPTKEPTKEVITEKPTNLNAKNLNQFTEKVPSDKIPTLSKDNPNDFAFPFVSNSQDTQISYTTRPLGDIAAKSDYKEIIAQGTELEFFPPSDGEIIFACTNRKEPDRITTIRIKKSLSANTSYVISLTILSGSQIAGDIIPTIDGLTETKAPAGKELHGNTQMGKLAAKIKGQASLTIALTESLDQPKKITNPDGSIRTFTNYTTYVTPEIFNAQTGTSNDWLRTSGGKIAIPQD